MTKIDDALVGRMERLVRKIAGDEFFPNSEMNAAARAIVAELPAPVDADLVTARDLAGMVAMDCLSTDLREPSRDSYRSGVDDECKAIQAILAALRRAREEGVK